MQQLCSKGADNIKLIIAEKPSVAGTIAKALGIITRKDGYFQSDEYYISWCIGHLVSSIYPQSYDEKYKVWKLEDLPIVPKRWKYEVSKDKKKQFNTLKKLMNSSEVTEVINACDSGREGELIFRLVYHHAGCAKPFKRLWTSSLEDNALLEGMNNLKNGADFDNLYRAADCRDKADWLIGMNLSRLLSVIYKGKLSVGRVKTPTLAMIAGRDTEIRLFKREKQYAVSLELRPVATGRLEECPDDNFQIIVSSEKFKEKSQAENLVEHVSGGALTVQSVLSEEKTINPPKLYDLTTLQRECNRLFKYTAQQTLNIAQLLYERKFITYPRTDSQYLTEDMEATALEVVASLLSMNIFAEPVAVERPNIHPLLDSSKVSDHSAIIPTVQIADANFHDLPQEQQQVLTLIAGKLLCAVSTPHLYESTKVTVVCENTEFTATGKIILEDGFKELERILYKQKEIEQETILPLVAEGENLSVLSATVKESETQPPKAYTEDTLLSSMERAGHAEYDETTEKKGIGTPATRASVIEGLVKDGYISRAKNILTATQTGLNLVSVVPEEIRSAKFTADWEEKLQAIERGEYAAYTFMGEIESLITALISKYTIMQSTVDTSLFQAEKEVIGVCPRCGGSVRYGSKHKNYYCDNRGCGFALWENNKLFASLGKKITKGIVQDFLTKGESYVEGFISKKTGKPFNAMVVVKDTGQYINFDLKFTK